MRYRRKGFFNIVPISSRIHSRCQFFDMNPLVSTIPFYSYCIYSGLDPNSTKWVHPDGWDAIWSFCDESEFNYWKLIYSNLPQGLVEKVSSRWYLYTAYTVSIQHDIFYHVERTIKLPSNVRRLAIAFLQDIIKDQYDIPIVSTKHEVVVGNVRFYFPENECSNYLVVVVNDTYVGYLICNVESWNVAVLDFDEKILYVNDGASYETVDLSPYNIVSSTDIVVKYGIFSSSDITISPYTYLGAIDWIAVKV